MTTGTLKPLSMAEVSWRRRHIALAAYGPPPRHSDFLSAQLARDIAERGIEPITGTKRAVLTERVVFHVIDGGNTEPPQPRYRPRPRPTPPRPHGGGRAA